MQQQKELNPYIKVTDHLVSGETFTLLYDSESDMLITSPQPEEKDLPKYYKSEAYISHTDANNTLTDKLYQLVKKRAIKSKHSLLKKHCDVPGNILDVGAGTGDFLEHGKKLGWNINGIETNADAVKRAAQKGVILAHDREAFTIEKFKAITFWHVLEHLPDYKEYLDWCYDHLEPNGVLIIAVPNYKSWDANYFRSYWAAYDAPRHLWHFSKKSIQYLAGVKFNLVKIKPMLFDSFYVSLLSGKNKTGTSNLISGFLLGLRSNLSGMFTKEYSSHIYVLKKAD